MKSFAEYFNQLISDWEVFSTKLLLTVALFLILFIIDKLVNRILDTKIESSIRSIMGIIFSD